MARELEAKMRVESHAPVRERLETAVAEYLGTVIETNCILDRPDGSLLSEGKGLRVRACRVLEGRPVPATITYKGPRIEGDLKHREEIETAVGDWRATVELLEALAFEERISFEKKRESWRLGHCLIELDTVPCLGTFVEIEGPDEATIHDVRRLLNLEHAALINDNYIHMLAEHCEANGLSPIGITLDSHAMKADGS